MQISPKIFIYLLLAITLFGCSKSTNPNEQLKEDNSLSKIKERGHLIIGTSADYAPREFHMVIDGKDTIVGYDIDIAKEIAKDMGVELKIKDMSFEGLLPALNAEHVDMVVAGMVPTPERLEAVDFSITYGKSTDVNDGQKLVIKTKDKDLYTSIESLTDKKLGVQKSGLQEQIAKSQVSNAKIIYLTKIPNMVMDLKMGKVDAIILASDVAKNYVNKNPDLYITDIPLTQETKGTGIAFKKGNSQLVKQTNSTLERLMSDGSMDTIIEKNEKIVEDLNNK
ncbi:transporter substrate-binding domain-containing protein [uncultured Tyzzerella sp.]|uniref:transporter substrate-binding domain-containing protein n=1 Tax=uncultured Tyzzerella sp. TaxID=2321398 RepID=UPI0029427E74|nr:transporter substrate-binding domain-containing protein [uncultured Tyzzerella sp.]